MISQKSSYCSHQKGSYSKKLKLLLFIEPATVVTELKAKVDVPAEVSSQIEAVNEGISK
jgi:DNA-binding transcriptional regulator YdaS (Cro superfamily)